MLHNAAASASAATAPSQPGALQALILACEAAFGARPTGSLSDVHTALGADNPN